MSKYHRSIEDCRTPYINKMRNLKILAIVLFIVAACANIIYAQYNNQRRTILQVTDVSTDRIVPSNTFERTKAQTLGLLVRIDLFDNSIKLQFMDDNGNLIEEPMILDYQQYN